MNPSVSASLQQIFEILVNSKSGLILAAAIGVLFSSFYWRLIWYPSKKKMFRKKSKPILAGLINEQLAPYFPGFPYQPSEVKFLGKPVDLVVFKGLDSGQVEEVIFIEIKTGKNPHLTETESSIRKAINQGKISWFEFRLTPDD